jgi:signal peptidase II
MSSTAGVQRAGAKAIIARFVGVAVLVVADLASKTAVFAWLDPVTSPKLQLDRHGHYRHEILGDWFAFMLSWNPGMAWGFDKLPPWLLVGGRVAAVGFLAWLVAHQPRAKRWLTLALVLILAGALGNLYDNLFMPPQRDGATFGSVRDFIDVYFKVWDWHFPTFNVADSCISVGAVLLFASSFGGGREKAESSASSPALP